MAHVRLINVKTNWPGSAAQPSRFKVARAHRTRYLLGQLAVILPVALALVTTVNLTGFASAEVLGPVHGESRAISSASSTDAGSASQDLKPTESREELALGQAAQAGPAEMELIPWRSKDSGANSLGVAAGRLNGFADQVAQLVGYNPFRIATIAGSVEVAAGLDTALASRLHTASTTEEQVYLVLPVLPGQLAVEAHLERLGAKVLHAIAPHGYAVKASRQVAGALSQDPMVYAVTQSPWPLKLDPALAASFNPGGADQLSGRVTADAEPGKASVQIYDGDDRSRVQEALDALGVTIDAFDKRVRIFSLSDVDAAAARSIAQMPEVAFVGATPIHRSSLDESVTLVNHDRIRNEQVYDQEAGVSIGMIDSGFQLDHDAFLGQSGLPPLFVSAWQTVSEDEGDAFEDNPTGHGTHVGGIMLSRWLNGPGFRDLRGMAPREGSADDSRFLYVRVGRDSCNLNMQNDPNCRLINTAGALDILANDNRALVINNSWGSDDNSGTNSTSVVADGMVWDTGQILVFSAGNDRDDPCVDPVNGPCPNPSINSPAAAKNVIAVGSVAKDRTLSVFSSEGPTLDLRRKPDVYAPGGEIRSADASNLSGFITRSGTSMAAPHVTGFLDTLLGHYPSFQRRPAAAKAYLMASASPADGLQGHTGILNSQKAHFRAPGTGGQWGWTDDDVRGNSFVFWDVDDLPSGLVELIVILTWVEPAPAAGAVTSVFNDVDLYVDHNKDAPDFGGEWSSTSSSDNVEVVVVLNPPAGDYRIKARPFSAVTDFRLGFGLYFR